jgi:hypothetical protein
MLAWRWVCDWVAATGERKLMMNLTAILTMGAVLALAGSAMAESACVRPPAPQPLDGATATPEQLQAAKRDAVAFIAASDVFQTCVLGELQAQRDAAKANRTKIAPAAVSQANAEISENQADKERVGKAFNAAAKAYKAAHPS